LVVAFFACAEAAVLAARGALAQPVARIEAMARGKKIRFMGVPYPTLIGRAQFPA
jgi:hypothetical protein